MERTYLTEWKRFLSEKTDYVPLIKMDNIKVKLMATKSGTGSTKISYATMVSPGSGQITLETWPGVYDVAKDIITVIITDETEEHVFECSRVEIVSKKGNGTIDYQNTNAGCEIKLPLKNMVWEDYIDLQDELPMIQLIINGNAETDPLYVNIRFEDSRFNS